MSCHLKLTHDIINYIEHASDYFLTKRMFNLVQHMQNPVHCKRSYQNTFEPRHEGILTSEDSDEPV